MIRTWRVAVLALIVVAPALCGCSSVFSEGSADAAGVAGAGIAGAVSKDATVGAAIGLGVASVANVGVRFVERRVHAREQDTIAAVAGQVPPGGVAPWSVSHTIPLEADEHGQVAISRAFGAGGFQCKEIVFSVDNGTPARPRQAFYIATICRDGETWKWATAEPATERWGSLQ